MIIILKEQIYTISTPMESHRFAFSWVPNYLVRKRIVKERRIVLNRQAYFYLEVWPLFDLLGLLLWRSLDLVLLLVPLQPPQLLLNTPALLPHLFSVLLIEEGKLSSATTRINSAGCFTFTGSVVILLVWLKVAEI